MAEQRERAGRRPLDGVRVIDASTLFAGPLIATILGDFGAEVLKVEHPRGDPARSHGAAKDGEPLWWKMLGRNKRAITLYLGAPEGQELFRRLAADVDVVIENFRPGTLERWDLGYDRLAADNDGLVLARITGFGQFGPYAHRPAFGTIAEAMSGFAHITGEPDGPPTLPPFGLPDGVSALTGAIAVTMALYARDARGGRGQVIDLALVEPLLTLLGPQATIHQQLGTVQGRTGNRSSNNAPRNTYMTRDGRWLAVSTSASSVAERVLRLVGHPEIIEQPWFATGAGRAEHAELLDELVGGWIGERDADEVLAAFDRAEAAIAPVYSIADIVADPQFQALRSFVEVEDPALGPTRMQNVLFRLSETPGRIDFAGRPLGADNAAVYGDELGLTPQQLEELKARGVV